MGVRQRQRVMSRLHVSLWLSSLPLLLLLAVSQRTVLSQLTVTVPKIPQSELETIVTQASLNVRRRLEVIEPNILASGESCSR